MHPSWPRHTRPESPFMPTALTLNDQPITTQSEDDTPLLWVLRDELGLTGTKFACGTGQCGACTVWLDGQAVRSCTVPIAAVQGKAVTTIEGLAQASPKNGATQAVHPVQRAWIEHQVPQCGYCQSGQIMAVAALLASNPKATAEDLAQAVTNLCRCGTYPRIQEAVASLTAGTTA
jgi:isoquinoline 1-oxidoreductase subunit alpha